VEEPTPGARIEGNYNFESLFCNLFRVDMASPDLVHPPRSHSDLTTETLLQAAEASFHARRAADAVQIQRLPDNLPPSTAPVLFHERLHYWQMISCPKLQWHFVLFLDKLRAQVAAAGGLPHWICGQTYAEQLVPPEILEESLKSIDAEFAVYPMTLSQENLRTGKLPPIFDSVDRLGENWITTGDAPDGAWPTSQLLLGLPHSPGKKLIGYGAMLMFPAASEKVVIFPFNGLYLMESAAYISQQLYEGRPLPKPEQLDEIEDQKYLGVWEYWRRLHGHRYSSEANLALAFLAAVDLTIMSDVIDITPSDSETHLEMFSLPYRFGKLAFALQGLEPLQPKDGDEPAQAVAQFQEQFCQWYGWPSPDFAIKKMAVQLTRIVVGAFARHIPATPENKALIETFLGDSLPPGTPQTSYLAEHFELVEPIWNLFQYATGAPRIGQQVLGNMLNACLYRIKHPGEFALPHLYHAGLGRQFPLPLVLIDGTYYLDQEVGNALNVGWPYPITGMETLHDLIALMTIKPLKYGEAGQCGFLEEALECFYVKSGLGCPIRGLTSEQREIREKVQLDDWCHWTLRSVLLRTAPEEIQIKWRKRWEVESGH